MRAFLKICGALSLVQSALATSPPTDKINVKLQEVLQRDKSISLQLQEQQQKIEQVEGEFKRLEVQKLQNRSLMDIKQQKIALIQKNLETKNKELQILLKELYQHNPQVRARVLLQAPNIQAQKEDFFYMKKWIAMNESMMVAYKKETENILNEKRQLEALQQTQQELEQKLQSRKASLELERQELENLRKLIADQKDYYEQIIREYEQSALKMEDFLKQWQSQQTPETARFAQMKGKLVYPLKGTIERRYGAYQDASLQTKLYHKGVDIRSPKDSPVKTVFDGKVVFANWFEGYGKTVIVDHESGYFTLYAHLNEFLKKVGDPVVIGDIIGKVGDTGSLKGAYLYFELRKKGISEDPLPWLEKK